MKAKEPCGCTHNGIEWLVMCQVHRDECDATAKRWAADRAAPFVPTTTNYHGQAKPSDWLEVPGT